MTYQWVKKKPVNRSHFTVASILKSHDELDEYFSHLGNLRIIVHFRLLNNFIKYACEYFTVASNAVSNIIGISSHKILTAPTI